MRPLVGHALPQEIEAEVLYPDTQTQNLRDGMEPVPYRKIMGRIHRFPMLVDLEIYIPVHSHNPLNRE